MERLRTAALERCPFRNPLSMHKNITPTNTEGRKHSCVLWVGKRLMLEMYLKSKLNVKLNQDSLKWQAFVNTAMKLLVS